ncbi:hypothetical protein LWI29_018827 [Acer saccharum]|uniref:Uncharacterized protein n=1 Tax=Acer saccharum TaxID=4024 RepID=A0AA39VT84_ACESA|nr:hypothetical protein LWI29_018827 [Acer saccharum]
MMDQTATNTSNSVHEKTEASAFMAGVEGVAVKGDSTRFRSDRGGSTRDLVAAVTSLGVNRKKRMARQRRSSTFNLLAFASSSSSSSSSSHMPPSTTPTRVIQAKKASDQDVYSNLTLDSDTDMFLLHDYEINKSSSYCVNYPMMDDTGMSFIYDTTGTAFSNDSPLDFFGGSLTNQHSRFGSLENFGSVENLSLDDFY